MTEIDIVFALSQLDLYPISKELTEEEINSKWKQLIRYYHPDINKTAVFQDGEKAKKVNGAHDFLIANLSIVNAYIRRINNIKTQEEILKEKQEQERKKAAEEAAKKAAEEAAKKAAEEKAKQNNNQGSYNRNNSSTSSSNTYRSSSFTSSQTNSSYKSSYNSNPYSSTNTSYTLKTSYKSKSNYGDESTLHKIIMFIELAVAALCILLSFILPNGTAVETGGYPLYLYILVFGLPVVILAAIPKTRKATATIFITSFLLFATVIMSCALFA